MYHLDTDICIAALKGEPRVAERLVSCHEEVAISSVVLGELYCGVYKSQYVEKNLRALKEFIFALDIVAFDSLEAKIYGEICAYLLKNGKPTGEKDALIGATALAHNATLVTHNSRHFKNIHELKIEDWLK